MTKRKTVLAIVATGTGNDIARALPVFRPIPYVVEVDDGTHVGHPAVQILRGRQVRLEASGIVSYADGERFAPLPISIEVVPAAVNVLVAGPDA